jgi:hypothetical protein
MGHPLASIKLNFGRGGNKMVAGPGISTTVETQKPWFVQGEIMHAYYGGETDDC